MCEYVCSNLMNCLSSCGVKLPKIIHLFVTCGFMLPFILPFVLTFRVTPSVVNDITAEG